MLKHILNKVREFIRKADNWKLFENSRFHPGYTSVPIWRPWRDF